MAAQPAAPQDAPINLVELRLSILARFAIAIHNASARLQCAAAGQSTFTSDADLKATLALLKLAPDILALLPLPPAPPPPPPPPPEVPYWKKPGFQIPLIPKCPICSKGPGAHWPADCPDNPDRIRPGSQKFD